MPIRRVSGGYQWGNHGKVYPNRIDAEKQSAAAHASGYAEDESFRGAGIVLIAPDNTVLFTLRSESCDNPNTWCFPGGQQDGNESPQETAIRETCEEAGYIAKYLKPFSTYTAKDGKKFYLFKSPVKHKFTPKLSDESTKFVWLPLDNPPEPLHYGVKAVLEKINSRKFAQDADKWITVHPNGANGVGRPALIGENGEVKGGMGGKFNGQKINEVRKSFVGPKSHEVNKEKNPTIHEAIRKQEEKKQSSSKWLSKSEPKKQKTVPTPSISTGGSPDSITSAIEIHARKFDTPATRINARKKAAEKFFSDAEKEESSLLDEIRRMRKIDQVRESELSPQYDKLSQLRHKMNVVNEYAKLGKNAK